MSEAIEKVNNKELSLGEASKTYNLPKATLFRRVADRNKVAKGTKKHLGRFEATFDAVFERELERYILDMESRLFGVTNMELRQLAFQLAERNKLRHNFNKTSRMAGKKWLYSFHARHRNIAIRKPEATSYARATGFNRPALQKFFTLLGDLIQKYSLDGSRIYNCDETGVKTVQQQHAKVLVKTGKHQVGSLTSAERGKT